MTRPLTTIPVRGRLLPVPRRVSVLLLALFFDLAFGDPPNRWHPVAWMGHVIAWGRRRAPRSGRWSPFSYGLAGVVAGIVAAVALGRALAAGMMRLPAGAGLLAEAFLLKTTFSLRGLVEAATEVEMALQRHDLPAARHSLGWHLVSRPTAELSESQVAAATIESLAENASDGVIAPLFFYAAAGLPAVFAYRFINTADAMVGYRDAIHEWLGKAPARLDDLANLIPAPLTALLLLVTSSLVGLDAGQAWRTWRRDAYTTPSPNAGHPMSVMAGALGVELAKSSSTHDANLNLYRLGAGLGEARTEDIAPAIRLVQTATWLGASVLAVLLFLRGRR